MVARRYLVTILAAMLVGVLLAPMPASAKTTKVDICHRTGNGSYVLLSVSEKAAANHIARHGDLYPGTGGLDANCVAVCPPQRIGHIISDGAGQWSQLPDLLTGLAGSFPVVEYRPVFLHKTVDADGIDAAVMEMEAAVNAMEADGITRIIVTSRSQIVQPFIEGFAGSLGGIPSDMRHPGVTFSATREGTTAVDGAANWYRAGVDFKSAAVVSPIELLPDVTGGQQFILATDGSPELAALEAVYTTRAGAAGYSVNEVDLEWNSTTSTFDHVASLGMAIAAAPSGSRVGIAVSAAGSLVRFDALTTQGLAEPYVFDPLNTNVTYLGLNFIPLDFTATGLLASIPVDLFYGVTAVDELLADEAGVNSILQSLGYPAAEQDARVWDQNEYGGAGVASAAIFAWFATCGTGNLDERYKIDANRQRVFYYIRDIVQPAGKTYLEVEERNPRTNPLWEATP